MNISEKGIAFLKAHEGFKTEWYDLKDGGLTVGFGNFITYAEAESKGIKVGQKITPEEADAMLHSKVDEFVVGTNAQLEQYGFKVNQNQFDALVSYAYNRGLGKGDGSNGLSQLLSHSKSVKDISDNLLVYWGTNETYRKGLLNRRNAEKTLFDTAVIKEKTTKKETDVSKKRMEVKSKVLTVTAEQLNVRDAPSNSGEIIGVLKKGATVEVLEIDEDGWAKLKGKERVGYAHSKYLAE